eukprot:4914762-Pleurochrysis_carterae.AAC.1
MPYEAILHVQKTAEVTVTARKTGQEIAKCPKTVPARAAISLNVVLRLRDDLLLQAAVARRHQCGLWLARHRVLNILSADAKQAPKLQVSGKYDGFVETWTRNKTTCSYLYGFVAVFCSSIHSVVNNSN